MTDKDKKKSDRLQVVIAGKQEGTSPTVHVITPKYDKDGKFTKESWLDAETQEAMKLDNIKRDLAKLEAKLEALEARQKGKEPEPKLKHTEVYDSDGAKDTVEIIPKTRKSV